MDEQTMQALERVEAYLKAKEVIGSVNNYIDGAFYIVSNGNGFGGSLTLTDLRLLRAELRRVDRPSPATNIRTTLAKADVVPKE